MNSDELLTQFRSDIPLPDEATAQQVYARATSARGRLARRGLVLALGAAIVAAIAAVALSGAFGNREGSIRHDWGTVLRRNDGHLLAKR